MRAIDVAVQRWTTCRVPGDEDPVVFDGEMSDIVQIFSQRRFSGEHVSAPICSLLKWKALNKSLSQYQ